MNRPRKRRIRSFLVLMRQLQDMPEGELALVAKITGQVLRSRRSLRAAAEAADAYVTEIEQGTLAIEPPAGEPVAPPKNGGHIN